MTKNSNKQSGLDTEQLVIGKPQDLSDDVRNQIIDYLYGELSPNEKAAFEQTIKNDPQIKKLMVSENLVDKLYERGMGPTGNDSNISDSKLEHLRWSVVRELKKKNRNRVFNFIRHNIKSITAFQNKKLALPFQLTGMVATFILGLYVANSNLNDQISRIETNSAMVSTEENHTNIGPLDLRKNDNYEIVDLELDQYNPQSGAVKARFMLASNSTIEGNIVDPLIQKLLAKTMKDEVNDSIRLELISLLKNYANTKSIQESLIYSLLNDPNPGVRLVAAQSLVDLADKKPVREVLSESLLSDINPGVRVRIFKALIPYIDDKDMIEVFKKTSTQDSNSYIRNHSKHLIQKKDDVIHQEV